MIELSIEDIRELLVKSVNENNFAAAVEYYDMLLQHENSIIHRQGRACVYFLMRAGEKITREGDDLIFPLDNYYCFEDDLGYFISIAKEMYSKKNELNEYAVDKGFKESYDDLVEAFCENIKSNIFRRFEMSNRKASDPMGAITIQTQNRIFAERFSRKAPLAIEALKLLYEKTDIDFTAGKSVAVACLVKVYDFLLTPISDNGKIFDPLSEIGQHHMRDAYIFQRNRYAEKACIPLIKGAIRNVNQNKSYIVYAILGIWLGMLGSHNFYAGNKKRAIIQLVLTLTFVGAVFSYAWAIYEGIMAFINKTIPEYQ